MLRTSNGIWGGPMGTGSLSALRWTGILLVLCCIVIDGSREGAAGGIRGSLNARASKREGRALAGVSASDSSVAKSKWARWHVLETVCGSCLRLRGGVLMHNDPAVMEAVKRRRKAKSDERLRKWGERYAAKKGISVRTPFPPILLGHKRESPRGQLTARAVRMFCSWKRRRKRSGNQ